MSQYDIVMTVCLMRDVSLAHDESTKLTKSNPPMSKNIKDTFEVRQLHDQRDAIAPITKVYPHKAQHEAERRLKNGPGIRSSLAAKVTRAENGTFDVPISDQIMPGGALLHC